MLSLKQKCKKNERVRNFLWAAGAGGGCRSMSSLGENGEPAAAIVRHRSLVQISESLESSVGISRIFQVGMRKRHSLFREKITKFKFAHFRQTRRQRHGLPLFVPPPSKSKITVTSIDHRSTITIYDHELPRQQRPPPQSSTTSIHPPSLPRARLDHRSRWQILLSGPVGQGDILCHSQVCRFVLFASSSAIVVIITATAIVGGFIVIVIAIDTVADAKNS